MPPRRFSTLLTVVGLVVFTLLYLSSSDNSASDSSDEHPSSYRPKIAGLHVPSVHVPFRQSSHKPPEQKDSASGETKWYSDWMWLSPFSSAITLDENRAVLPRLRNRPPVYTFYDTTAEKDAETRSADRKLLLTWRRAWWAQGFRPIVLGRGDAMKNPLYETLHTQIADLDHAMENDIAKWLAWGHMGTGIMANWPCVPMGPYEDPLLSFLRRGEYPGQLTRYENLGSGLIVGEKTVINNAVKQALSSPNLARSKSLLEAIPAQAFKVDQPSSIAYYDSTIITKLYPTLAQKLVESPSAGRLSLNELMNSHLHTNFQNVFKKGISVIKPLPKHTTALVDPALHLANLLAQCPPSLIPTSCPPNMSKKCTPCNPLHPMPVSTPPVYRNSSDLYIIGTLPHPYTLASLQAQRAHIDTRHIRRNTDRDTWISAATKEILGTGRGGAARVVKFKEAVASDYGHHHSLWLTVESLPPDPKENLPASLLNDLEWHFGFPIPRKIFPYGESDTPVPGPKRLPQPPKPEGPVPTEKELALEIDLLRKARDVLKSKEVSRIGIKEVTEAWNMADAEVWRFVRAYRARSVLERQKWEEEEKGFGGES
jgi:hypothetical protein